MDSGTHKSFSAMDRSYLAILKKDIRDIVAQTEFPAKKKAEIDIIVAELASNLVKHGRGGEILFTCYAEQDTEVIELIAIDNGPGIADVTRVMKDGISTTNTLGHGLGAIERLSDFFEIYSLKDWGTIVLSRVYKDELPQRKKMLAPEIRAIVVPKPGEEKSGDGCYVRTTGKDIRIFIGDGLGHGPDAHHAVIEAIRAFRTSHEQLPSAILRDIHTAVKRTRGLVCSLAIYNIRDKKWLFSGVGNIASRIHSRILSKNIIPYNGIVGMNMPATMKDQDIPNERNMVIVMCSDGIKSRWDLQKYPSVLKYDLTILAAALFKDFARRTDDMSVVVSRIN